MVDLKAKIFDNPQTSSARLFDDRPSRQNFGEGISATLQELVAAEVAARVSKGTTFAWAKITNDQALLPLRGYEVEGLGRLELSVPTGSNGDVIAIVDRGAGFTLTCPLIIRSGQLFTGAGGLVRSQSFGTIVFLRRQSSDWMAEVLNGYIEVL